MEITVISEQENPMLHRTDVRFRVSHAEATPDRLAVRDSLAARLNKDANEVVVRKLDTKFGMRETIGEAKVYQGAEFAEDVEQDHMLVRNKIGDRVEEATESEVEGEGEDADVAGEASEPEVEAEEADDEEPAEDEAAEDGAAEEDEADSGDGEEADASEEADADVEETEDEAEADEAEAEDDGDADEDEE